MHLFYRFKMISLLSACHAVVAIKCKDEGQNEGGTSHGIEIPNGLMGDMFFLVDFSDVLSALKTYIRKHEFFEKFSYLGRSYDTSLSCSTFFQDFSIFTSSYPRFSQVNFENLIYTEFI